jgi:hypothetical protein
MASQRGDKLIIKMQQNSSGTVNKAIAATTSVNWDMTAEALDATSQDSGEFGEFVGGKFSGTATGDYLTASDGEQYTNLYAYAQEGTAVEVELYRDTTLVISCQGVITSLSKSGALSDSLGYRGLCPGA